MPSTPPYWIEASPQYARCSHLAGVPLEHHRPPHRVRRIDPHPHKERVAHHDFQRRERVGHVLLPWPDCTAPKHHVPRRRHRPLLRVDPRPRRGPVVEMRDRLRRQQVVDPDPLHRPATDRQPRRIGRPSLRRSASRREGAGGLTRPIAGFVFVLPRPRSSVSPPRFRPARRSVPRPAQLGVQLRRPCFGRLCHEVEQRRIVAFVRVLRVVEHREHAVVVVCVSGSSLCVWHCEHPSSALATPPSSCSRGR